MTDLKWIFERAYASGAILGGDPTQHVIIPTLENFSREALQNSRDQVRPGQIGLVRISLIRLREAAKFNFIEAMGWSGLEGHIEGAAAVGSATIRRRLREGLQLAGMESPLLLLRIEDSGTYGLTGGEDDPNSNFNALCRNKLVTSESRRNRIGSFGLGKLVLWRHSLYSTVLFSSRYTDEDEHQFFRLFGRAELADHTASGTRWAAPGWFGQEETIPDGRQRAVSIQGTDAEELARQIHLYRAPELGDGTSILVVGFFEPTLEEQRLPHEIASDLLKSTSRWFWPSLHVPQPTMRVSVDLFENDTKVSSEDVELTPEVRPFVLAATSQTQVSGRLSELGQVAACEVEIKVPPRLREDDTTEPAVDDAKGRLLLRLAATDDSTELSNKIALLRGAGMVVQYRAGARNRLSEQTYFGVLEAGLAHGTSEKNESVEQFLRAAEPPTHDRWTHETDRIHEYPRGAQANLNRLWASLDAAVVELTQESTPDTGQGPSKLAELFPIPTPGREPPRGRRTSFPVDQLTAEFDEGVWTVRGRVRARLQTPRQWSVTLTVRLDSDAGEAEPLPLASATIAGLDGSTDGTSWAWKIPPDRSEVRFTAVSAGPGNGFDIELLRRTRVLAQVTAEALA